MIIDIGIAIHILASVVWVGGMFFAYMALRPASAPLEPKIRLALWRRTFERFFPWVWVSVIALLLSGYGMVFLFFEGFDGVGVHVHLMQASGIAMMLLFAHVYFSPYQGLRRALDGDDLPAAAAALDRIRGLIHVNLWLGLFTVLIGATGRYWG